MMNVCIDKRLAKCSHFLCLQLKKLRCREVNKISCPKQHKFVNGEEAVISASDVESQVPEMLGRQRRMSYVQLEEWCEPRREQVVLVKKLYCIFICAEILLSPSPKAYCTTNDGFIPTFNNLVLMFSLKFLMCPPVPNGS